MKRAMVSVTAALAALVACSASLEYVDQTVGTNKVTLIMNTAGDHVTIVNSDVMVTNAFTVVDYESSSGLRSGRFFVGITNSTLTSLSKEISFMGKQYSGNTTRVDVVGSTINVTNSYLELGVNSPSPSWKERVFFNATNSTFHLDGIMGWGALDAVFDDCRLFFGDKTAGGFGGGSDSCVDMPNVTFRNSLVTNYVVNPGAKKGGAPSVVTFDGGTAYLRNIAVGSSGGTRRADVRMTNGSNVYFTRPDAEQLSSAIYYEFGYGTSSNVMSITKGATVGIVSRADAKNVPTFRFGKDKGGYVELNIVGGTFDNSKCLKKEYFYLGYTGQGTLNLGEGGVFNAHTFKAGAASNNSDDPTANKLRINQTGGLFWSCFKSEDSEDACIELAAGKKTAGYSCWDAVYTLDGGVLKTPQLYGGASATCNGGDGRAVLSANGGTIKPGYNSTKKNLIHSLDLAECGPKGLTVDTSEFSAGAIINQEFTNKVGEAGLFRKVGANTLTLTMPGRYPWGVSETRVEGGTLTFTAANVTMNTHLVVTNGATLSTVGTTATLTLDALSIPGGTLSVDPGDKIVVPADRLDLGDFNMTFSSALGDNDDLDVFVCTGSVSSANMHKIRKALLAAVAFPSSSIRVVETEVVDGVTHIRVKTTNTYGPRLTDFTVWEGSDDAWSTDGNWSAGVPTADVWAEFPSSAALKALTVPSGAVAGSLRFTSDGYTLSGAPLRIAGPRGSTVISVEAGTNTIASAIEVDESVEITNAPNTKLVVSGVVSYGGIEKKGKGALELRAANALGQGVELSGGKTTLQNAQAFASEEGLAATSVSLNADSLEFGDEIANGSVVDGSFMVASPSNSASVAMIAKKDVTINAVTVSKGGFIKAGPAKLTMLVSGGEKFTPERVQHANNYNFTEYFVIGEDGLTPNNADHSKNTEAYFGGLTIYEGELVLKAAPGKTLPVIESKGAPSTIGVHTDGASATPTLTLDGVHLDCTDKDFFANGFNLGNRYNPYPHQYNYVPSLVSNKLNLVNGAMLTCQNFYATKYGAGSHDMKPVVSVTSSTIRATTQYHFANNNKVATGSLTSDKAVTISRMKGATLQSPSFLVDGKIDADLDGCTMAHTTASSYAKFEVGTTPSGTLRLRNGSVFRVGTFDLVTSFAIALPKRLLTLAFDNAEWQYGAGDYTFSTSFIDSAHLTNFVIRMEGRGVVLKPAAETTFTTEFPFQGEGGIVVDGPGTVAFLANTAKFTGTAEVKSGTLDLSAEGTLTGFAVKGPGTIYGATFVSPRIVLDVDDEWGCDSAPTFDGCTISGRVTVDCGRDGGTPLPLPAPAPIVVARFAGAVPDVSGWKLKGVGGRGAVGQFAVVGDTVVMSASSAGAILIVR